MKATWVGIAQKSSSPCASAPLRSAGPILRTIGNSGVSLAPAIAWKLAMTIPPWNARTQRPQPPATASRLPLRAKPRDVRRSPEHTPAAEACLAQSGIVRGGRIQVFSADGRSRTAIAELYAVADPAYMALTAR